MSSISSFGVMPGVPIGALTTQAIPIVKQSASGSSRQQRTRKLKSQPRTLSPFF